MKREKKKLIAIVTATIIGIIAISVSVTLIIVKNTDKEVETSAQPENVQETLENGIFRTADSTSMEVATAKEYTLGLVYQYLEEYNINSDNKNQKDFIRQKIANGKAQGHYFITIDNSYQIIVYKGTNSSAVKSENKLISGVLTETGSIDWN